MCQFSFATLQSQRLFICCLLLVVWCCLQTLIVLVVDNAAHCLWKFASLYRLSFPLALANNIKIRFQAPDFAIFSANPYLKKTRLLLSILSNGGAISALMMRQNQFFATPLLRWFTLIAELNRRTHTHSSIVTTHYHRNTTEFIAHSSARAVTGVHITKLFVWSEHRSFRATEHMVVAWVELSEFGWANCRTRSGWQQLDSSRNRLGCPGSRKTPGPTTTTVGNCTWKSQGCWTLFASHEQVGTNGSLSHVHNRRNDTR